MSSPSTSMRSVVHPFVYSIFISQSIFGKTMGIQ